MNPEEFRAAYPLLLTWIKQTLAVYAPPARPISSRHFSRLPLYFSPATLAPAKVIPVDAVPLPPLSAFGLSQFADFEHMDAAGITYLDSIFIQDHLADDERLHFHELVHVVQWSLLGPERFLAMYTDGLERYGYRDSPLEAMAYRLEGQFWKGGAACSVEEAVVKDLKALGGD